MGDCIQSIHGAINNLQLKKGCKNSPFFIFEKNRFMFKKAIIFGAALFLAACSGKSRQEILMSHDWYYGTYISVPAIKVDGKEVHDLQTVDCFSKDCYVVFHESTFDIHMDDKNCLTKGNKGTAKGTYKLLDNGNIEISNKSGVTIEWEVLELSDEVFHYKASIPNKVSNEIRLIK